MPWVVDERFGAVCKNCKMHFNFSHHPVYGMGLSGIEGVPTFKWRADEYTDWHRYDQVTYPKGDLTVVQATCVHCNARNDYDSSEITVPSKLLKEDAELHEDKQRIRDLEDELEEVKGEKTTLEGQLAEAYNTIKQKDADISKFAEGFFQIGKRLVKEQTQNTTEESGSEPGVYH